MLPGGPGFRPPGQHARLPQSEFSCHAGGAWSLGSSFQPEATFAAAVPRRPSWWCSLAVVGSLAGGDSDPADVDGWLRPLRLSALSWAAGGLRCVAAPWPLLSLNLARSAASSAPLMRLLGFLVKALAPLLAARWSEPDSLRVLLAAGADIQHWNRVGNTAMSFAKMYDHHDIATILEESGAQDCGWPPHSIIKNIELQTAVFQSATTRCDQM